MAWNTSSRSEITDSYDPKSTTTILAWSHRPGNCGSLTEVNLNDELLENRVLRLLLLLNSMFNDE
jgi:hypothetical protein